LVALHRPLPGTLPQIAGLLVQSVVVDWHRFRLQSVLLVQLLPATLHTPLMNGQSVSAVQTLVVWMLHLPANVGGGQVVV
jgi:hypothetical protein